ncbi:hypothetical protein RCL1_008716 [Eukaryota sp. TZLM3-RCL]
MSHLKCLEPDCPILYSEFLHVADLPRSDAGSQSVCFIVKDQNNTRFFVKIMPQNITGRKEELARFNFPIESPYLIRYLHCYQDVASTIFVMEYHEGGSLHRFIEDERKANRPSPFSEQDIWCIFCQILSGVDLLHQAKIIHRDLKLANILLESRKRPFKIKICDFGISKELVGTIGRTMTGSPGYIAPEVQQSSASYGPAVDYFSLGVILYHLTEGGLPFPLYEKFPMYTDFSQPPRISPSNPFNQIISGLLAIDPSKRFNFDMLMSFPKIRNWFYPAIIEQCKCAHDVSNLHSHLEYLTNEIETLRLHVSTLSERVKNQQNIIERQQQIISDKVVQHDPRLAIDTQNQNVTYSYFPRNISDNELISNLQTASIFQSNSRESIESPGPSPSSEHSFSIDSDDFNPIELVDSRTSFSSDYYIDEAVDLAPSTPPHALLVSSISNKNYEKVCANGVECRDKDNEHIQNFLHAVRPACRYGISCVDHTDEHHFLFSHPGSKLLRDVCREQPCQLRRDSHHCYNYSHPYYLFSNLVGNMAPLTPDGIDIDFARNMQRLRHLIDFPTGRIPSNIQKIALMVSSLRPIHRISPDNFESCITHGCLDFKSIQVRKIYNNGVIDQALQRRLSHVCDELSFEEQDKLETLANEVVDDVFRLHRSPPGIKYELDQFIGTDRTIFATLGVNTIDGLGCISIILNKELTRHPASWLQLGAATYHITYQKRPNREYIRLPSDDDNEKKHHLRKHFYYDIIQNLGVFGANLILAFDLAKFTSNTLKKKHKLTYPK